MNKNKLIVTIVSFVVMLVAMFSAIFLTEDKDLHEYAIKETLNTATDIIISNEVLDSAKETKQATEEGQDISTTEVIESNETEEQAIVDEGATEVDAIVDQENISYDGDNSGEGLSLLGSYQGLTYYSQADSRWANVPYTSTGNASQTIKSSGCGSTSAAMVVSSSKGAILPTTMSSLFVSNGFRTANSGTAWSAFPFVADYFGFNEYHSTSNFNTMVSYLTTDNDQDGNADYIVIASCGSGLFTSGGHYIVLVGDNNGTIQVYDPYLYSGKFTTASRRNAGAVVSGNSVFVSESAFRNYANYKNFWIFSNDKGSGNNNTGSTISSYTRYVATQSSSLRVRNNPNGAIIGSLAKGSAVTVYETSGAWSRIGINRWVSTAYLSASPVVTATKTSNNKTVTGYRTGTYKTTSNIHVRSGAGTNYKAKTYKQLSSNARSQNRRLGGEYNGYRKGVTCTVIKIKGNWGYTKSGWICLSYCKKI